MCLRSELTRITRGVDLDKHPDLLAELLATHPHSVEIVQLADPGVDFNCVMMALDLVGSVEPPCSALGRYHMDTSFLRHLIQEGNLTPMHEANPGALAVLLYRG